MVHKSLPSFAAFSGSRSPKILFIGEAWGESEAQVKKPFIGSSGKEFFRILGEAVPEVFPELHTKAVGLQNYGSAWFRARDDWATAAEIAFTNVFAFRPPANKIEHLCGTKTEVGGKGYQLKAISQGKYLREEYFPELTRLREEISTCKPALVVALGNTACWALTESAGISAIRGTVSWHSDGYKLLATYHPSAVLRNWSWRPIVVADLMKAWRECQFRELVRPKRQVLISPTLPEIENWVSETLQSKPALLSCDIETGAGQIKCVGFARSRQEAIVIPFVDLGHGSGSYWPTLSDELRAWGFVKTLLESPFVKLFQNGVYDLQYLMKYGLQPKNCTADSMLLHHAIFPEMQKGLGFLGSIYSNEASWKLMNRRRVADKLGEKKDE